MFGGERASEEQVAHSCPAGTRAIEDKGPNKRVLFREWPPRREHRVSLSPVGLTVVHPGIIWGSFKALRHGSYPQRFWCGMRPGHGILRSSLSDPEVQPGLRVT